MVFTFFSFIQDLKFCLLVTARLKKMSKDSKESKNFSFSKFCKDSHKLSKMALKSIYQLINNPSFTPSQLLSAKLMSPRCLDPIFNGNIGEKTFLKAIYTFRCVLMHLRNCKHFDPKQSNGFEFNQKDKDIVSK